ncbi:MAG: mechanosensitive ion channel family protein [Alphaproteobacteria bacterium]|nr:mechanosensitive ion channel family protein [Alphaproteobacteria bacterium]
MNKDLTQLKTLVIDVWENGIMGVDIGQIIIALAIFFAFLLIRGMFSRYVLNYLHTWASKTTTKLDDKIVDALIPPIKFIPIILGIFFASQYMNPDEKAAQFMINIERSMIAFTIFWALHRTLEPLSHSLKKLEQLLTRAMMVWMFKVLKVLVVFIGGAVILEIWGIAVGPLLAGLGLFGAAVALGAQDLFKNLIGGITILAEKRFHPGEWIMVDGVVEGVVEEIGFRSTRVRRFDKAPVHVPNANLSDTVVTNFSRMTHRRIKWAIGVEYKTNVEQLQIIRDEIMKYIIENDKFASPEDVSTFVRVDSFNASSIDFLVYCFTKTTVWGEWLEIKEEFALVIKEIVEEKAGTGFAFPSQSIYIENLPGETAETFIPPQKKS